MSKSVTLACPHCGAEAIGFDLLNYYRHERIGTWRCFLRCHGCFEPIVASYPGGGADGWFAGALQTLPKELKPSAVWPAPKTLSAPGSVPSNIGSLYIQAMAALGRNHYDAAGPLFRRIMEVALKAIHPDGTGSLYDRIIGLPEETGVTPTMKQWAHAVRLIGRDATHDADLVTKEEAEDMQAFVELFLVYAFDLPSRIVARKAAHTTPTTAAS